MEFKELLEKTGFKVKENRFLNSPTVPYIVFFDDQIHRGADYGPTKIIDHNVMVQLYVKTIEDKQDLLKVENVLDSINVDYERTIEWMDEEAIFKCEYTFECSEKKKRSV